MKKLLAYVSIIGLCFIFLTGAVEAQTYRRGIVQKYSYIYNSPSTSDAMLSINKYPMWLSYPEAVEIVGDAGNFYQIKFLYSGYTKVGYILKANVLEKDYVIDENYKQGLINQGFPASYADKLAALHAIHPNWVFTPSFTGKVAGGIDFNSAVKSEAAVIDRNLIQTSDTSLLSTAPGAYANGQWIGFSGGSWYAVSEQTIAYFLDPRNFMNESNFFMFENQAYDDAVQYESMVEKSLADSFMKKANPFICSVDSKNCTPGQHFYSDTFIDAGKINRVNPINLASRVKAEQGTGSPLSNGLGWNGQYIGYYNFFNIYANGTTQGDVVLNGLKYAYSRGWNNPYISIVEGAGLIGNNYVSNGQSTVYYQKFNTINLNYSHQYMQNILAPYTEGYSTFISYYNTFSSLEEWDNATYGFLIPVYTNMPAMTSLDASYNADATLQSLSISNCNMNPTFESGIKTYACYAQKEISEVEVLANATSASAKVEYQKKVSLTSDETPIQIKVTAGNGFVEIYEVKIYRIETDGYTPNEILNGIGIKASDEYASNFVGSNNTVSGIVSAVKGNYHFADIKIVDAAGKDKTNEDAIKTGDIITVTNAGVSNSYRAILYGDVSGDGIVDIRDLLFIQQYILNARSLEGAYYKAADVNKDGGIDIRDLLLVKKYIEGQYEIVQE